MTAPPGGDYDNPRPEGSSVQWFTPLYRRRMRADEQRAYDLLYPPRADVQATPVLPPIDWKAA